MSEAHERHLGGGWGGPVGHAITSGCITPAKPAVRTNSQAVAPDRERPRIVVRIVMLLGAKRGERRGKLTTRRTHPGPYFAHVRQRLVDALNPAVSNSPNAKKSKTA